MLDIQQVQYIAKLARLGLKNGEAEKFAHQLNAIFQHIEILDEAEIQNVEPTCQVTGLQNILREDRVERFSFSEELLRCTELPVVREQIQVQPVIVF